MSWLMILGAVLLGLMILVGVIVGVAILVVYLSADEDDTRMP